MKKIINIVTLLTLGITTVSYASIDKNLKYGQRDKEVTELQEFLIDKGFLKTTPSTFFGLLTLKAVKAYQTSTGVSPTGFVGILTREKINKEIEVELASSNEAEIQETGSVAQNTTKTLVVDICKNIEGIQSTAPTGMFIDNSGNCFTPSVAQVTVTDVCKNIEGNQTTAPSGMFLDNLGNCFTPTTVTYTSSVPETKKVEPLVVNFSTEEKKSHLYISSNKDLDLTKTQFIKVKDGCVTERDNCSQENRVDEVLPITIPNTKSLLPSSFVYRVETSAPFENFTNTVNSSRLIFLRIKFFATTGEEFKTLPLVCQVWNITEEEIPNAMKVWNMSANAIRERNGTCDGLKPQ